MSEKSKFFMDKIWEARNNGSDTEEKLVASILKIFTQITQSYGTQDGRVVFDQNDILSLVNDLETND
jgi:hypothetical protein